MNVKSKHILASLEEQTSKRCIMTSRRQLDWERSSVVEYDEENKVFVKKPGETRPPVQMVDCFPNAQRWQGFHQQGMLSPLRFFLDGSRRTYKIADIPIGNRLYPLVAGQVGVGVCERENKKLRPYGTFKMFNILAVPSGLDVNGKNAAHNLAYFDRLKKSINASGTKLQLDDILCYTASINDNAEDLAIMQIQNYMMMREKVIVRELVTDKKLSDESWLVKDGSLEYTKVDESDPYHYTRVKDNYKHVIGLSKSFNPELMQMKGNKSASRVLAELPVYHRTPAFRFVSGKADGEFAIWYIRIRKLHTFNHGPFDGIVKVEKLLIGEERDVGLNSDEVDDISAWIINERNPACYGKDSRWANHIYPVYLTENYIKSKYMSTLCFTHLF